MPDCLRPQFWARIFTFAGAATLSACSSILETEAPPQYRYFLAPPPEAFAESSAPSNSGPGRQPSLHVNVATVGIGLNTDRIIARTEDRLSPTRRMRWIEDADTLLEKSIVEWLQTSKAFAFVTDQRGGPGTTHALTIDLRSLYVHIENEKPVRVEFAIAARIRDRLARHGDQAWLLQAQRRVSDSSEATIIAAFHEVTRDVLMQLRTRLEKAL